MAEKNEEEKIDEINDVISNEELRLVAKIEDRENRKYVQTLAKRKGEELKQRLKKATPDCIDLIRKMLTFDPN